MFSRSHQDIHVTSKNVSVLQIIVLWYLTYVLTSNSETNNLAKCTLNLRSRGNSMAIKEVKEYNKWWNIATQQKIKTFRLAQFQNLCPKSLLLKDRISDGESVGVPVTEPGSICDKTIYETLKREAWEYNLSSRRFSVSANTNWNVD